MVDDRWLRGATSSHHGNGDRCSRWRTVQLVPHHTLSLWNRYDLSSSLGAGVGVVHRANMYAAIDNTVVLPAFTRLDGGLFVGLTRDVRAQLSVENITNERHYPTPQGNNNIMPAAPRSLTLSLTAGT